MPCGSLFYKLQTGLEFYLKCPSSGALFTSPISFDDDGKERKDLIQVSHGKYHYTEIIFINFFFFLFEREIKWH